MGISKHTAVLTTTIDRGHDECRSTNGDVGFLHKRTEVRILVRSRIFYFTTTGTENKADINGAAFVAYQITGILHTAIFPCSLCRAYLAAADNHRTLTGACLIGDNLTDTTCVGFGTCMVFDGTGKRIAFAIHRSRTHRTVQTTAIDTIEDITAGHRDTRVAMHIGIAATTIDVTITDSNLFCTFSHRIISSFTSLIGTDVHFTVTRVGSSFTTCYISILTTTEDITGNVSTFGVMRIGAVYCNSSRNILTTCCGNRVT